MSPFVVVALIGGFGLAGLVASLGTATLVLAPLIILMGYGWAIGGLLGTTLYIVAVLYALLVARIAATHRI